MQIREMDYSGKEILIIHTWGIGDLILLTPVLRVVKTLYPELRLSMLFFPKQAAMPVLEAPFIHEISYSDWNLPALVSTIIRLRKKKYYAVMFSSGVTPWKAWLFYLFIRAEHKIGEYRKIKLPFVQNHYRFDPAASRTQNNYQIMKTLLPLPGWQDALRRRDELNLKTYYHLSSKNEEWADKYLRDNGLNAERILAIHPGCMAKNKYRRWPAGYFISLIKLILTKYPFPIVIIAGPDELDVGEMIARETGTPLLSGTSLANVAAFIAKCSFFVNTDSGLGHIASCFEIPSLTIFGPGNENHTAPFSPNSHVIRIKMDCAPCVGTQKRNCKVECLVSLNPEAVFEKLVSIIET